MGSFYMESTQINYRRDETVKTVDQKLQELSETSAIDTDIAPVFKSTNTYAPGDMVYYRNKLYTFNVEHSGAWAAGDVTATDVTTEISSLRSGLTNVDVALSVPENSGKNLIPLSLDNFKTYNTDGTWASNVYSENGIDFTVNTDASGAVTSISASGTASATAMIELRMDVKKGVYTLNGCPSGGSAGYYLQIYKSGVIDVKDRGDGATVNLTSDANVRIGLAVGVGLEVTNLIFYPMLRLSTITDPTFTPYIPSVESRIEAVESSLTNNTFKPRDIISATTSDGAITTYGFIQHMTQVYVIIPVNKPISATSFTVTDIESFFVRYDGHLVDALANITNITGQTVLSNGCLQFAVNFNTGTFSGVEHMPAIITINAKITFV